MKKRRRISYDFLMGQLVDGLGGTRASRQLAIMYRYALLTDDVVLHRHGPRPRLEHGRLMQLNSWFNLKVGGDEGGETFRLDGLIPRLGAGLIKTLLDYKKSVQSADEKRFSTMYTEALVEGRVLDFERERGI